MGLARIVRGRQRGATNARERVALSRSLGSALLDPESEREVAAGEGLELGPRLRRLAIGGAAE